MVETAFQTFNTVDLILAMVDSDENSKSHNEIIFDALKKIKIPVFLLINKIDLVKKGKLLPLIDYYQKIGSNLKKDKGLWSEIIPISALHQEYIDSLLNKIIEVLPEGPHFFPDDIDVGHSEKFIVSEFIREKAIEITQQEVPYSLAVMVENIEEGKKGVMVVDAIVYVERDSQKGIIIGKNGYRLKEIGKKARVDIENWFGTKIYLNLYVKVKKEWRNSSRDLRELGYSL
jgi:GTP-binding protein Era